MAQNVTIDGSTYVVAEEGDATPWAPNQTATMVALANKGVWKTASASTADHIATFADANGNKLKSSGVPVANIATNAANIATNAANIATNAANIALKVNTSSIVNDDTTGGATVPASAEIVKTHGTEIDTINNILLYNCSAALQTATNINDSSDLIIPFNIALNDPKSILTTGAAAKITPNVSGKYNITAQFKTSGTNVTDGSFWRLRIEKNGTTIIAESSQAAGTAGGGMGFSVFAPAVSLNGTSDYVQAILWQNTGNTIALMVTDQYCSVSLQRIA